ncbi:C4-type Zn-finger protein [Solitalea canadensis DSM 3403]|uniref:C4-type Zn-finger protein n=2 Tax=Solitalea canadensis TaxID=995 RepID=H8KUJ6_SOLCM|nr:C4-type Zn-finger protein [Solitalea canadensis DSM 3403]
MKMQLRLTNNIDKLGTTGLFITAIFSPCCFPLFAFAASALGLGSFEFFGSWTMLFFQLMVLVALIGLYKSYQKHQCLYPLLLALLSGLSMFYAIHFIDNESFVYTLYAGMFGLLIATIWNYKRNKMNRNWENCTTYNGKIVELNSTISCPECGYKKNEIMPTDSCVYFYECENCKAQLKPKQGDCCVYCSYGTVKCPPIQAGETCC